MDPETNGAGAGELHPADPLAASDTAEFKRLLEYLRDSRGFDFSGYKRSSLVRRVQKAMAAVGLTDFGDYVEYLEVHPDEFTRLFNTILINVTSFFRDAPVWEYLSDDLLPRLARTRVGGGPIRVWSAGCAGGQEPYSLAMALAEALGPDAFRERVKIYATDIDEEALAGARVASYSDHDLANVPGGLRDKYFVADGERQVFRPDLRRCLIFGRHDLLQDAPISRVDLLVCRNTIMYFNAEVQGRILDRFHFAVNEGGHLVLGKAEMLFTPAGLFQPLDLKRRVFVKNGAGVGRARAAVPAGGGEPEPAPDERTRLREAAFQADPVARIIVDRGGTLVSANERARALFRLGVPDLGRPLQDLELSYRPVELRSLIDQAESERRAVTAKEIPWSVGGEPLFLDAQVVPLLERGVLLGAMVSFPDVSRLRQLSDELEEAGRELETALEELQSVNEELETTNEELQSTNEELETTNEELQSTNEELETTNEELQATNDELQATNEEQRRHSGELDGANAFLESVLTGMRGGVIVLDRDLCVQRWNGKSQELWGMRSDEVAGRPFQSLDIGLPVDALLPPIRACLQDRGASRETVVDAHDRRGRAFRCAVVVTPLVGPDGNPRGVILLTDPPA